MNLLLDTHILIWYGKNDPILPKNLYTLINNHNNNIYVSLVSFLEMAIKINVGKLELGKSINKFYEDTFLSKMNVLPISEKYITAYSTLPLFEEHKDTFDRLIITTAIVENLSIISIDKKFNLYKELVEVID
jgi:PIN domain nuclease of toxin-antitoxin system